MVTQVQCSKCGNAWEWSDGDPITNRCFMCGTAVTKPPTQTPPPAGRLKKMQCVHCGNAWEYSDDDVILNPRCGRCGKMVHRPPVEHDVPWAKNIILLFIVCLICVVLWEEADSNRHKAGQKQASMRTIEFSSHEAGQLMMIHVQEVVGRLKVDAARDGFIVELDWWRELTPQGRENICQAVSMFFNKIAPTASLTIFSKQTDRRIGTWNKADGYVGWK